MTIVNCLFCNNRIEIEGNLEIKQLIECHDCHQIMEVVWLFPLELVPIIPPAEVHFQKSEPDE